MTLESRPSAKSKEQTSYSNVATIACMDDALHYGRNSIIFGMAGSGVINSGSNEVFPEATRKLFIKARRSVFNGLKRVAAEIGCVDIVLTSHAGCGATKAQELNEVTTMESTRKMAQEIALEYAGHIGVSAEPQSLFSGSGESKISACITRPLNVHQHDAVSVIITTGGGITEEEKIALKVGNAFVISADALTYALQIGEITQKEAVELIEFQVELARKIMKEKGKNLQVVDYNSGRLNSKIADENLSLIHELLTQK